MTKLCYSVTQSLMTTKYWACALLFALSQMIVHVLIAFTKDYFSYNLFCIIQQTFSLRQKAQKRFNIFSFCVTKSWCHSNRTYQNHATYELHTNKKEEEAAYQREYSCIYFQLLVSKALQIKNRLRNIKQYSYDGCFLTNEKTNQDLNKQKI